MTELDSDEDKGRMPQKPALWMEICLSMCSEFLNGIYPLGSTISNKSTSCSFEIFIALRGDYLQFLVTCMAFTYWIL